MQPSLQQVNSVDEQESQRAARLRNNKRRNRQRQKDYTAGLETQLRELQSQGVQATQEVQMSARKVVEDNVRLRALLQHIGVADHVIDTWKPNSVGRAAEHRSTCEKKCTGASKRSDQLVVIDSAPLLTVANQTMVPMAPLQPESTPPESTLPIQDPNQNRCNNQNNIQTSDTTPSSGPSLTIQLAPCKVLTRLAEDPGADVTQPIIEGGDPEVQEIGGVECHKAHNMLMQFATTEEKLDVISQALEQGCVKKAGGGCKVRNEALWKAIDDVT
ncbi:hypothetical protein DL98DRAFT_573486 [Cadophora sp. DSE1049]|nr:hypothetical protein DL98DRAFT_573486 [Cadophora sp. DSE1049]